MPATGTTRQPSTTYRRAMRTATITPLPQPSATDAAPLRDDVDAASHAPQDARLARARTALNTLAARSRKSATTGKDNLVAALNQT